MKRIGSSLVVMLALVGIASAGQLGFVKTHIYWWCGMYKCGGILGAGDEQCTSQCAENPEVSKQSPFELARLYGYGNGTYNGHKFEWVAWSNTDSGFFLSMSANLLKADVEKLFGKGKGWQLDLYEPGRTILRGPFDAPWVGALRWHLRQIRAIIPIRLSPVAAYQFLTPTPIPTTTPTPKTPENLLRHDILSEPRYVGDGERDVYVIQLERPDKPAAPAFRVGDSVDLEVLLDSNEGQLEVEGFESDGVKWFADGPTVYQRWVKKGILVQDPPQTIEVAVRNRKESIVSSARQAGATLEIVLRNPNEAPVLYRVLPHFYGRY